MIVDMLPYACMQDFRIRFCFRFRFCFYGDHRDVEI